ncbi:galanin receptor type 1-like [Stylophora pistillata]|uniref:galanin receptor type 1-like n=1 Tax=Stylophora pistillata TaxID=50429 RepID=UPI000C038B8A|nr:galanin receptor type 1-like [Stylophora pistillata]
MSEDNTNISESSNQTEEGTPSLSEAERTFKVVFYCCLFIFGSLGNLLVILVVKRKLKNRRTINDYFILNLAVADLAFLWLSLPFYTYDLYHPFNKNLFYCKLIWPMMSVTLSVSVFTLTSMAIERCRGITNPLQPRIKLQATLIWIFLIWIFAFFTIVPLIIAARSGGVLCTEHWPKFAYRQAYTAVLFAFQYVLPLSIIAIAYLRITMRLITSRLPMRTSINSRGQVIRQKTRSENIQIIRTLAVIVTLFMACMLPNQIAWVLLDFGGASYTGLTKAFWTCAEALLFLHACVNPIAYGSLTGQFRHGYARLFRSIFCCKGRRLAFPNPSDNRTSAKHSRKNHNGVIVHGSLKCKSVIENTNATQLNMQSSPTLSITGERTMHRNSLSGFFPQILKTTNIDVTNTNETRDREAKAETSLSYTNSALEASDEENSVKETRF